MKKVNCIEVWIFFSLTVSGRNYFQLITVSKNMLVIYAESIDEDKTIHLTEVVGTYCSLFYAN